MSLLAEAMKEHFHPEQKEGEEVKTETTIGAVAPVVEEVIAEEKKVEEVKEISDSAEFVTEKKETEAEIVAEKPTEVINLDEPVEVNVSKYTDGEFEKIDDLVSKYKELKDNVVTGDTVMEMLDKQTQEKYGLNYSEVVAWKNIDYSAMDSFDVLAEYEELKDPDVTDKEIAAELQEFELLSKTKEEIATMIEDGDLTQRDFDSLTARFTKTVRVARQELTKHRDSLDLGSIKVGFNPTQKEAEYVPSEEDILAQKNAIKQEVSSLNGMRINLGSKDAEHILNFDITTDEKSVLSETVSDPSWLKNRWSNEDGSTNRNKAYRDAYILINHNKMLKAAYSEGIAKGVKDHVVGEDNIQLKDGKQISAVQSTDKLQELANRMEKYS